MEKKFEDQQAQEFQSAPKKPYSPPKLEKLDVLETQTGSSGTGEDPNFTFLS